MNIEVFVATHKKVDINLPSYCHLIQVGSSNHNKIDGYLHDDSSQPNISLKNPSYCELTALYFLWKHSQAEIKGLFHYRRMFSREQPLTCNKHKTWAKADQIYDYCISEAQIHEYLKSYDIIDEIPYNPFFTNVRKDLQLYCYQDDIESLQTVIDKFFPEYANAFNAVMGSYHISYCNMMIAKSEIIDSYCSWLFDVLDKCEQVIDVDGYDDEHKRVYGYLAEVLMNVWIKKNGLREKYVPELVVSEYMLEKKRFKWLRWQIEKVLRQLGKRNISIPNYGTKIIKGYNIWWNSKGK